MADNELTIRTEVNTAGAKAGADQIRNIMARLHADLAAKANVSISAETSANQKAMEAKRQVRANQAEAEIRLARRTQEQELGNVAALKRARTTASDDAVRNYQRIGDAARRAGSEGRSAFGSIGEAGDQLGSKLASLAGTVLSVGAAKSVASEIERAMAGANEETQRQLDKLRETKALIREIGTVTSAAEGSSDAELQKHLNVRKASGLTASEAKDVVLELHGAGEINRDRNISSKEFEKLDAQVGRFSATQGGGPGSAGTYGKLGGLLLGVRKFETSEDVIASLTQVSQILGKGVGDNPTLIKQSAQLMGATIQGDGKGLFKDERELAAMISTASMANPDQSAEMVKSEISVLRGFSEQWAPLLKTAGVKESDSIPESKAKLEAHLKTVQDSGRSIDAYLGEQGVTQASRVHVQTFFNNRDKTTAMLDENKDRMTGPQAMAAMQAKFDQDVSLRTPVAQAKLEEAQMHNAMNLQYSKPIELEAETALEKVGQGKGSAYGSVKDYMTGLFNSYGGLSTGGLGVQEFGHRIRLEKEMNKAVTGRGMTVPEPKRSLGDKMFRAPVDFLSAPLLMATGAKSILPMDTDRRGWLTSGDYTASYSAVGQEEELAKRVGGSKGPQDGSVRNNPRAGNERRIGDNPYADADTMAAHDRARPTAGDNSKPMIDAIDKQTKVIERVMTPKVPAPMAGTPRVQNR